MFEILVETTYTCNHRRYLTANSKDIDLPESYLIMSGRLRMSLKHHIWKEFRIKCLHKKRKIFKSLLKKHFSSRAKLRSVIQSLFKSWFLGRVGPQWGIEFSRKSKLDILKKSFPQNTFWQLRMKFCLESSFQN